MHGCVFVHNGHHFHFLFQEGSPFIVCMTYAFQTPEKLCFILDLMNGGDLHYHLSQHGVFSEKEVRFYAAEVMLGLEHMHNRFVVYRDLKVRVCKRFCELVLLCFIGDYVMVCHIFFSFSYLVSFCGMQRLNGMPYLSVIFFRSVVRRY